MISQEAVDFFIDVLANECVANVDTQDKMTIDNVAHALGRKLEAKYAGYYEHSIMRDYISAVLIKKGR